MRKPLSPFTTQVLAAVLAVGVTDEHGFVASDIVRLYMSRWGWTPEHPNQWGGAFRTLSAMGIIEPVSEGYTYQSHLAPRNGGRNVVWQLTTHAYALIDSMI